MYYPAINTIDDSFDIASTVRRALAAKSAQMFTYDNFAAASFTASSIVRKALYMAVTAAITVGYFTYCFVREFTNPTVEDLDVTAMLDEIVTEILTDVVKVEPASTVVSLRAQCTLAGIVWRNANGKSRHMTKGQMTEALVTT
jgi:hypothetical protein